MTKEQTSERGIIAYVGPISFPEGGAAARRVLGNAQSLRAAGFNVLVGAGQLPYAGAAMEMHKGISVYSLGERTAERYPTMIKHLLYFNAGKKTLAWLDSIFPAPEAVILYSGYAPYFMRLIPWCKSRRIPLIFDAVEWYEPSSVPGGAWSPYRWSIEMSMRYFCVKAGNIIAISSYLEQYYRARKCTVIRIPPTLDTYSIEPRLDGEQRTTVTVGFTGTPGPKDVFDNCIEGILRVADQRGGVLLRLAGVTPGEVMAYPAMRRRGYTSVPSCIEPLGRMKHADALELIRQADYSVLLRPPLRYAQAGFPTKVVESLAVGTPVICNITSDLGSYIHDGIEGTICADCTVDGFVAALLRALDYSEEQRRSMRIAARRKAVEEFDVRNYSAGISKFIDEMKRKS